MSVHISLPASTARRKQYGASTVFCTATSDRPSPLNHFWCNLQVCCSFLTVRCAAPPYNTLLVMAIWNFLSSLILSRRSLNSTMNKKLDPIKCRISLNIIFFSYISIFLREENWPEVLVGQVLCWVLDIVPHNQKLVWKDSKLSSSTMSFQWYFLWCSQGMFSFS